MFTFRKIQRNTDLKKQSLYKSQSISNRAGFLKQKRKGFTLIETLVAITIMSIGIAAPLTVTFFAIRSAEITRDQAQAFFFAQEGIEYIRFVRDTNILEGDSWLDDLSFCMNGSPCDIRDIRDNITANGDMNNCGGGTCNPVLYDGTLFANNAGDETKFIRDITITESIAGQEAEIVVTVTWTTRTETRSLTLRERIFNWSGT